MGDLSKSQKLLLAAGHITNDRLKNNHGTEFTAEDLTVQAHRLFPADFSMKGYHEHPDSNRVFTQLMGKKAVLVATRGWFEKTGVKQWRLTSKGLDAWKEISEKDHDNAIVFERSERQEEEGLVRLLTSTAYKLFKDDKQDEITFHQFCLFAGLLATDNLQKFEEKQKSLRYLVDKFREKGSSGMGVSVFMGNHNKTFSNQDLLDLYNLYNSLNEEYRDKLDQWREKLKGRKERPR